jgi:insulysin
LLQLWHKQDTVFKKPKGIVFVDLSTPLAYDSPANTVLTRLFSAMIKDGLNEFAYDAEVAGLHYEVLNTTQGMQIQLSGYNDKLLTLLEAVCAKVAGFEGWAEEQRFALLMEQT